MLRRKKSLEELALGQKNLRDRAKKASKNKNCNKFVCMNV
jgi:hypothetical protein